jgi:hypothetical protein
MILARFLDLGYGSLGMGPIPVQAVLPDVIVSEDNSELEQARMSNPIKAEKGGYGLITVSYITNIVTSVFSYEYC